MAVGLGKDLEQKVGKGCLRQGKDADHNDLGGEWGSDRILEWDSKDV